MSDHQPPHNDNAKRIPVYSLPEKIHPKQVSGRYRTLRLTGGAVLFLLFFGISWLNWGERQAVLFDLAKRQFHIFGITLWPQDFILLSCLLIICAFGLFAMTVLAGRIWCGYACPQSVFSWVFIWLESLTEGKRNQRIKLDKQPLTAHKLIKKVIKHTLWLATALVTAFAFVGYFTPVRQLPFDIVSGQASAWVMFWLLFFTAATYLNAGWLRETVCLHMCPYARFQSVMFDNDTLVVAYNSQRGEPRKSRKHSLNAETAALGDCIDCKACEQVCPTGIDIRNGLQYQCIGCAACIDACDSMMDKVGYEKGLISYTTGNLLTQGQRRIIRPRLVGYISALLIISAVFTWRLSHRPDIELDVLRDRNTLFRTTANGTIENSYIIKTINKTAHPQTITLSVQGLDGIRITHGQRYELQPGEVSEHIISLTAPPIKTATLLHPIEFTATADNKALQTASKNSRFMIPLTAR